MITVIQNIKINTKDNELIPQEIRINNGRIEAIGDHVSTQDATLIDGQGCVALPGFVDVHVHFREPGFEAKETIKTGALSAAMGGFTTVCAMPNTNPVIDSKETLARVNAIARRDACVNVLSYAAITKGLRSQELTDFEALKEAGCFALTNDGVGVQEAGVMYRAMLEAKRVGLPLVAHTEDDSLLFGGVMHEGIQNKKLGLPGMLGLTESTQIARDILLAKKTGVHYHVCHVSDEDSVEMIRLGKKMGVHVSAEVTPHHLLLVDEDIKEDDANYKMNPPLRSKRDQNALIKGLLDGTLDFIATDHAPHTHEEKSGGFMTSPFGIVGLETAFPLMYSYFVKPGVMTLHQLIEFMSTKPAQTFGLDCGVLEVGAVCDMVLVDLNQKSALEAPKGSKSSNTPFIGTTVYGTIKKTFVKGSCVYES